MGASSEYHIKIQDELMQTIHQVEEGELGYLDGLLKLRKNRADLEDSLEIIKSFETDKVTEIGNEASKYPKGYQGHDISVSAGRKTYSYKGIEEFDEAEKHKKYVEKRYSAAFEGLQKGIIQTSKLDENDPESPLGWIDEDGQVLPFPDISYGKSFVTVKEIRQPRPKK